MSDEPPLMRDVRNHVLFEVATEVANRGIEVFYECADIHVANMKITINP